MTAHLAVCLGKCWCEELLLRISDDSELIPQREGLQIGRVIFLHQIHLALTWKVWWKIRLLCPHLLHSQQIRISKACLDSRFLRDVVRLGSNSSVTRCVHDTNILNQPNKPGHLRLWKNRYCLGLRNPDDLLESDSLRLLTLTMYMDQRILFPVSRWTYDVV